jgi:hypothetical protein
MIWAIASSAFVIYLYRRLKATSGSEVVEGLIPDNLIDAELATLNSRIDRLERIVSEKTRRATP